MRLLELRSELDVEFMSAAELEQRIARTQGPRQANHDVHKRIKYLHFSWNSKEEHFVIFDGQKLIADLSIQQNPYDKKQIWLMHIAVDPAYQNKGLATRLLEELFKYLKIRDLELVRSSPSDDGKLYVQPVMQRLRAKYPEVVVHDSR
jgi:ribosomal protein S18 acetylase RimI-like enzyme